MNWLAKINLNIVAQRLGSFRSALLLIVIVTLCLYGGYRMGNFFHAYQTQTLFQQEQRLTELYAQQNRQVRQINTLEVELEVERLANQSSHDLLKSMEVAHYQVKKELAFYEKVMAPEKQADGLVFDSFAIVSTGSENHFRFKVTLVQQQIKKRYARGYLQLALSGSLNKKPSQFKLSKISTLTQKDLAFNFQYFQIIEGEFTLPEGFVAEKIALSAIMPKSKWQKYHRLDASYFWKKVFEVSLP
jgi:predicted RND superfamily exporter protein